MAGRGGLFDGSDRRVRLWIFIAAIAVRAAYAIVIQGTAFADSLQCDNARYDEQSDGILQGNHDLETPLFITAPFYSYLQAAFKWTFGGAWLPVISVFQLLLSAWSVVVLWSIARDLFGRRAALVAAALYLLFPPTLIWVVNPAQETLFQVFLIFFIRTYLDLLAKPSAMASVRAASMFAITFLTKSHILLFLPFLFLHWWVVQRGSFLDRSKLPALFVVICGLFTLPYGLSNLRLHGIYVLSSTGQGGHFLTGHNQDVYRYIVDPPPMGSPEHTRIHKMDYLVMRELADTLAVLPHKADQQVMLKAGLDWCRTHPKELVQLTVYDLGYFLLPGVNWHHYTFKNWLMMFAMSFPVYLLAYAGLLMAFRERLRTHGWMLGLILSLIVFSCAFYVQNRFRTITVEPFYLMYAAFALVRLARPLLQHRIAALQAPVVLPTWPPTTSEASKA